MKFIEKILKFIERIRTNPKLCVRVFLCVAYVLFLLFALHAGSIMYETHCTVWDAFGSAFPDMILNPLGIFPVTSGTLFWIIAISAVFLVGGTYLYLDEENRKHYKVGEEHGTARWLGVSDLDEYNKRFSDPIGETNHDGPNNMILSQDIFAAMNEPQVTRRNLNVFIIGGSGSGKSYNFVGPNLMQANSSYVVTDPSGGLFKEYGTFLECMGYRVKCFNLSRMDQGNHYNPFMYIHSDKDIEVLVTTLISNTNPPDKNGGDPFWEKSETALLVALIAYLHSETSKPLQNFSHVMELMRCADIDENNSAKESDLDLIFGALEKKNPQSFALNQYKTFKMGAGKTLKGILISCAVRLQAFDLKDVKDLTDTDNIELDRVGDEKTALFVIIPTGEKTFNFLASLMYSQLFQRMYGYCEGEAKLGTVVMDSDGQVIKTFRAGNICADAGALEEEAKAYLERAKNAQIRRVEKLGCYGLYTDQDELVAWRGYGASEKEAALMIHKAREKIRNGRVVNCNTLSNHGERLPIHTRLILDEFANIGKIPEFPEKVATIRKYEISVAIILQSLSQMKKMYKDEWEELSGNCDSTIYLGGGADQMTTEWISKLLGKETRFIQSASYSKGGGSVSIGKQGVELFSPDQLRTMDEDDCIVLLKSQFAFKGRKYMSHLHPNRKKVQALEKNTGGYRFDDSRSDWFINALKGTNTEHGHEQLYGKPRRKSEKDKEIDKKKDDYRKTKKNEAADNRNKNGERKIGPNVNARDGNSDLSRGLGLSEKTPEQAQEDTMDVTDPQWAIPASEFKFSDAPKGT